MWSPRSLDNAGRDTATLTSRYITPVTTTPSPGHRLFKYFFRMDSSPHQLLPGHPGGVGKSKVKRICEWLLQVLLSFLCLQLVTIEAICNDGEERYPQAPECLDCQGRRFFLGIDQLCKMCIQCQPGYEHDKECGNGVNGDSVCVQCPEDHYSYNLYDCVPCRLCENTLITQECSVSTDRQCGECLPGFYKDPQNPDFCNQRCEWLSDPDTIPACKAWLDDQQITSLSADISMTSSFPGIIDEEIGRESTIIIIIIIILVVVVIGGSVIPVYLCCKYARSKSTDIERGNPGEPFQSADAFTEIGGDGEGTGNTETMADGASESAYVLPLSTDPWGNGRPTGVDAIEQVRASPIMQRASELDHAVPLSTGLQQDNTSGDVTSEVTNIVPVGNGPEQKNDCGSDNVQRPKGLDSVGAQGNEDVEGEDQQDGKGDTGQDEPNENRRLLPDQSQESPVISQVEDEHVPACQDSERGGRCEAEEGEKDGNEEGREEHDTLLKNAQVEDIGKGASGGNDEKCLGSAEDELLKCEKDRPSTISTVRSPPCNCVKTSNVTYHIDNVTNLVVNGNQNNHHHHHNGEYQPSSGDDDDELDEA